jgi:Zn-dependent oligopeptidase
MTKLIQQTFDQIAQLPEDQQDSLAIYIQKNLIELLKKSEKENEIDEEEISEYFPADHVITETIKIYEELLGIHIYQIAKRVLLKFQRRSSPASFN